jgi:hypothetical protein
MSPSTPPVSELNDTGTLLEQPGVLVVAMRHLLMHWSQCLNGPLLLGLF